MLSLSSEYDVEIIDLTIEGYGIAKINNFTVFVEGAVVGDILRIQPTKIKKNYGFAKIVSVVSLSKNRQEPKCKAFGECGGCTLSHIKYNEQLRIKQKHVLDNLKRIAYVDADVNSFPIIGMEYPLNYRNNAQFVAGFENNKIILGYFKNNSHDIIPIESCELVHNTHKEIIEVIKDFMDENKILPYNFKTKKGLVRHIIYRIGFATNEKMVCFVLNGKKLPNADSLIDKLKKIDGLKSLCININETNGSLIMGENTKTLWGKDSILDFIGEYKFEISAGAFYQINPVQTKILYDKVVELAQISSDDVVADLFCGIGTISIYVAKYAKKVYGIEISKDAIKNARKNADLNKMNNVFFIEGAAESRFAELADLNPSVIIVDPPRKGCQASLLEQIIESSANVLIYVSCASATLSRDIKILSENGFKFDKGYAVDCFCMTTHVECVVRLVREKITE